MAAQHSLGPRTAYALSWLLALPACEARDRDYVTDTQCVTGGTCSASALASATLPSASDTALGAASSGPGPESTAPNASSSAPEHDAGPTSDDDGSTSDDDASTTNTNSPEADASLPDAEAPTPTSLPSAVASSTEAGVLIGECDTELLINPSFEQGALGWRTETTAAGIEPIVHENDEAVIAEGISAYSEGMRMAWLGGVPDHEDTGAMIAIEQRVQIPAGARKITFSGHFSIMTQEDEEPHDSAFVDLLRDDGQDTLLWFAHQWTNVDHTHGWMWFEFTADADDFADQTALLRIHSETDPMGVTSFWFDELSLVVTCGR